MDLQDLINRFTKSCDEADASEQSHQVTFTTTALKQIQSDANGRTRWVDFKMHEYDSSHIEPGWRAWMNGMVDKPPTEDPVLQSKIRPWETPDHKPNFTLTRGAYRCYNTVKPKISAWEPVAAPRM